MHNGTFKTTTSHQVTKLFLFTDSKYKKVCAVAAVSKKHNVNWKLTGHSGCLSSRRPCVTLLSDHTSTVMHSKYEILKTAYGEISSPHSSHLLLLKSMLTY